VHVSREHLCSCGIRALLCRRSCVLAFVCLCYNLCVSVRLRDRTCVCSSAGVCVAWLLPVWMRRWNVYGVCVCVVRVYVCSVCLKCVRVSCGCASGCALCVWRLRGSCKCCLCNACVSCICCCAFVNALVCYCVSAPFVCDCVCVRILCVWCMEFLMSVCNGRVLWVCVTCEFIMNVSESVMRERDAWV
jgi:hypothetical protein